MLTAHEEPDFPEPIPYSDDHPLIFEENGQFIFGCDENELILAITARTADYYAILSDFQDKVTDLGLAPNGVHVVGEADEILFPSFRYYFSECKRLGILHHTLAFDLKNNLSLLGHIDMAYKVPSHDPEKININTIVCFLHAGPGCAYEKYTKDFGNKFIQEYIDQLTQDEHFIQALHTFSAAEEKTTCASFNMYSAIKRFVASFPNLLTLNDYDTLTPKYLGSFQELQEFSSLTAEKKEQVNPIVNKIMEIQHNFESLKENHKSIHQTLLKEIIQSEGLVPLSVLGYMQCRSSFLNDDAHKVLPEILPNLNVELVSLTDIETFMRYFHEKATFIKTLSAEDNSRLPNLNLLDMHLILQRFPLSVENTKTLGHSYKMVGQFHMDDQKKIYGLPINQYIVLNLIYQIMQNLQSTSPEELDQKTTFIEKIITEDNTVMLPLSLCIEASENAPVNKVTFNRKENKFDLPKNLIESQQKASENALEKLLNTKNPVYYIYQQDGVPFGHIGWFFK